MTNGIFFPVPPNDMNNPQTKNSSPLLATLREQKAMQQQTE